MWITFFSKYIPKSQSHLQLRIRFSPGKFFLRNLNKISEADTSEIIPIFCSDCVFLTYWNRKDKSFKIFFTHLISHAAWSDQKQVIKVRSLKIIRTWPPYCGWWTGPELGTTLWHWALPLLSRRFLPVMAVSMERRYGGLPPVAGVIVWASIAPGGKSWEAGGKL